METYPEVDQAAANELKRLEALEHSAWLDSRARQMPMPIKVDAVTACVGLLTIFGVLLRDGNTTGLLIGAPIVLAAWVGGLTWLERHYASARPNSIVPPKTVRQKQFRASLAVLWPICVMVPAFMFAVDAGARWWVFSLITGVSLVAMITWGSYLQRRGTLDRITGTSEVAA